MKKKRNRHWATIATVRGHRQKHRNQPMINNTDDPMGTAVFTYCHPPQLIKKTAFLLTGQRNEFFASGLQ
jgi:hypothetical protein